MTSAGPAGAGGRGQEPVRVVVLADTHLRSGRPGGRGRWLPGDLLPALERADLILHAGDVVDAGVIDRLRRSAPVVAVLGNNDHDLVGRLPETVEIDIGGVRVGMVHDSGPVAGRPARLRRRFPHCRVVVFGHSHTPVDGPGRDGQLLFNPGSPTQRRRQPWPTYGELVLGSGRVMGHRVVALPVPGRTGEPSAGQEGEAHAAAGVVGVGVDQADRLPRAELHPAAHDRDGE